MWTNVFFLLVSAGLWLILDGFTYRMLFAAIPFLFAAQITLSDALEDILISRFGWKTKWFAFMIAPGTILHELSHLFAALATGASVTKAQLFKPNPKTGVLGFVSYTQPKDKWYVYREFIIGFAPFFSCGILLLAFNVLLGGGLSDVFTEDPISSVDDAVSLISSLTSSMAESASRLNLSKPAVWLLIYLQFCFLVGAAPSSGDFKGSFSSLRKHLLSSASFLVFMVLTVLLSDQYFDLYGAEKQFALSIALFLKFTVVVLLLSITLLFFSIPLAYVGIKLAEIRGLAKTIPVTASFLVYYFLVLAFDSKLAFTASAFVFVASIYLLRR